MSALKTGVDQVSGIAQAAFENKDMDFDKFLLEYRGQKTSGDKAGIPTHYLELMIYLHQKPSDQYTGLEAYVNDKIQAREPDFFPLMQGDDEEEAYLEEASKLGFEGDTPAVKKGEADEQGAGLHESLALPDWGFDGELGAGGSSEEIAQMKTAIDRLLHQLAQMEEQMEERADHDAEQEAKIDRIELSVRASFESQKKVEESQQAILQALQKR
jgi:hypothetical protein